MVLWRMKCRSALKSGLDVVSVKFGANRAALLALLGVMREQEDVIRQGGGAKAAEAQRAKGRLTVRERLALLLDPAESGRAGARYPTLSDETGKGGAPGSEVVSNFLELGLWAAYGMYAEYGETLQRRVGVVTGLGRG